MGIRVGADVGRTTTDVAVCDDVSGRTLVGAMLTSPAATVTNASVVWRPGRPGGGRDRRRAGSTRRSAGRDDVLADVRAGDVSPGAARELSGSDAWART